MRFNPKWFTPPKITHNLNVSYQQNCDPVNWTYDLAKSGTIPVCARATQHRFQIRPID
jgi:hypothetical protein